CQLVLRLAFPPWRSRTAPRRASDAFASAVRRAVGTPSASFSSSEHAVGVPMCSWTDAVRMAGRPGSAESYLECGAVPPLLFFSWHFPLAIEMLMPNKKSGGKAPHSKGSKRPRSEFNAAARYDALRACQAPRGWENSHRCAIFLTEKTI